MTREEMLHDAFAKAAADQGLLIEAGFRSYRKFVMARDAPDIQVEECRFAFFAGCQHLYASVLSVLDEGEEITATDLRRMELVSKELDTFAEKLKLRIAPNNNNA